MLRAYYNKNSNGSLYQKPKRLYTAFNHANSDCGRGDLPNLYKSTACPELTCINEQKIV